MESIYEQMNKIDDNESLNKHYIAKRNISEGIFDGGAKKEANYKEVINTVFKDSDFRNPSVSFGLLIKDCLSDWIESLSSDDTKDERSGNASTYATTFVKQAMILLKQINKPTRDTVLDVFRLIKNLKFNNGEQLPQSFDNLNEFYKLYINVLGKEKDGFKIQEYLAPMMCKSLKIPLEACIRRLKSEHLIGEQFSMIIKKLRESLKHDLSIEGFEHTVIDTFEDDGVTGRNVMYSKDGMELAEIEIWDETSPISVHNVHIPNMFNTVYDDFESFANDLRYKAKKYLL